MTPGGGRSTPLSSHSASLVPRLVILKLINLLIKDGVRNGHEGIGKLEAPKLDFGGYLVTPDRR